MSSERESFVFYRSFWDALKTCDDDVRLSVLNSIFFYMFEEPKVLENIQLTGMSNTIFTLIKPQLDSLKKKYNAGVQNRLRIKEHRPSKKTNHDILMIEKISKVLERNITSDIKSISNVNDNVNDNVNVNVDIDRYDFVIDKIAPKEKKKKIFIVPTMEQWLEYFRENGTGVRSAAIPESWGGGSDRPCELLCDWESTVGGGESQPSAAAAVGLLGQRELLLQATAAQASNSSGDSGHENRREHPPESAHCGPGAMPVPPDAPSLNDGASGVRPALSRRRATVGGLPLQSLLGVPKYAMNYIVTHRFRVLTISLLPEVPSSTTSVTKEGYERNCAGFLAKSVCFYSASRSSKPQVVV